MQRTNAALGAAFTDKRVTTVLMTIWVGVSLGFYSHLGAFQQLDFMTFGPSAHTKFMGATLDTWTKWGYVATFSFLNTCIHEFISDALVPWMQNTIQDHKTRSLPYGKWTCLVITCMFTIYTQVTMMFSMFLYMSQVDFLIMRMVGDLLVNIYSTHMFLACKKVDADAYAMESHMPYQSVCIQAKLDEGQVMFEKHGINPASKIGTSVLIDSDTEKVAPTRAKY